MPLAWHDVRCEGGRRMTGIPGTTGASGGRQRHVAGGGRRDVSRAGLDDLSKQIVEQLQQDGRRSYAAIGKAIGLSEAAVRQRVQRLQDSGAMQIVAVTDPMTVGFRRQAMIGGRGGQRREDSGAMQIVAVTDPMTVGFRRQSMIGVRCGDDLERVADQLADMDEIDYVVITAGSFDLLIEVVCENDDQLLEILSRVRSIPSVTTTETFVYLKLRKQTYSWGTR